MIYLHTTAHNPAAPLLLLHLPSLTLASLVLAALPGGSHLLTVASATPPPDEAFEEFAAALDRMAPGASDHLAMVTRENLRQELPEFIPFAPMKKPNPYPLLIFSPRHRFVNVPQYGSPLNIWQPPLPTEARQQILQNQAQAYASEFLATLPARQAT